MRGKGDRPLEAPFHRVVEHQQHRDVFGTGHPDRAGPGVHHDPRDVIGHTYVRVRLRTIGARGGQFPVPLWGTIARFNTELGEADGTTYGSDLRLEYSGRRLYGFAGYGYSVTEYESAQGSFSTLVR
jgi:hypothetical protein